jgi:hypothetical protein
MKKYLLTVVMLILFTLSAFCQDYLLDIAMVKWGQEWYFARIEDTDGDEYYVSYPFYGESWNEWVGPDRIVILEGCGMAESGGTWWFVGVLNINNGSYDIRYDRYNDSWDETVTSSRFVPIIGLAYVDIDGFLYKVGILEEDGNEFLIRYHTKDSSWDQWAPAGIISIE